MKQKKDLRSRSMWRYSREQIPINIMDMVLNEYIVCIDRYITEEEKEKKRNSRHRRPMLLQRRM